jgi:phage head maturation protease
VAEDQPEFRVALDDLLEVRADVAKREIDMRLLPWDHQIDTLQGPELFRQGAFEGTNLNKVLLYGPNHEARFGLGQDGQPSLTRVPIGKAIALSEPEDGPHATFRVARTAAGDEALALAADGIVTGVSVEFRQIAGGTDIETRLRRARDRARGSFRTRPARHR